MDNDAELRKYFEFDEADLFANRNGYMSPRQQTVDLKDTRDTKRMLYIVGLFILVLAILPVIIFLINLSHWQSRLWVLIGLPIGLIVAYYIFRLAANTKTDDTLKTVEGRVSTIKEEHEDGHLHKYYDYYWNIGGVQFDVIDSDKVDILEQGDTYRVYYLDLAKQILSLEKVTK